MSVIDITFPGNLAQVDTAADLRDVPSSYVLIGALYIVIGLSSVFVFKPSSSAVDDGTTVLKPADRTSLQAGRWIKSVNGFAPGSPGAAGPAGPTAPYATVAELKAAPTANGAAILTDPDLEGTFAFRAGDFTASANDRDIIASSSVPVSQGAWVRMAVRADAGTRIAVAGVHVADRVLAHRVAR